MEPQSASLHRFNREGPPQLITRLLPRLNFERPQKESSSKDAWKPPQFVVRDGFIPGLVEDGCTRRPPPCKAAIELGSRKDQERRWGKSRRGGFGRWRSWGDSPRTRRSREAEERLRLLREVGAVADAAEGRAGKGQRRHETNGERNARRKRSKGSWRGPLYTTDDFYWEVGAFDEDLVNRRRAAGLLGPEAGVGNDESWEWGGEFINSEAAEPECLCQILHPDVGVMTSGAPARQDQLGTAAPGVDSEAWPEVEAPSGWGKLPATPPTAPSPPACAYQYAAAASKRVRVENPTGWGPQNGVEAAERRLAAEAGVKEPGYGQSAAKPLGEVKPGKSTKRESASTDGSGSSGLPLLHIFTEGIGKRESAGSVLCACWKSRRGGVREEGLSKERGSLDEQPAKWLGSNGANSQGNTRDAGGVAYEAAEVDLRTALAQLQKRTVYGKGMRFFRRWEGQVAASRKPEGAFLKAKAGVVLEGCMSGDEQRRAGATSLSQNTGADTKEGAGVTGGVAGGVAEEDQTDEKAALKKVVGEGALAEKETRTQARRRRGKEARRRRRERRALRREERKRVLTRRVQKLEARGCIRKASLVKEYLQGLPTGIAVRQAAAERRARKALRKVGASGGDAAPPLSVPDCLAAVGEMSQTALEGCGSTGAGGAEGNGAMGNGALQAVLETTKPEEEPANSAAEGSQSRAGSTQYQLFGRVLSGPTVMVKVPSGATAREVMHAILAKNKAFPGPPSAEFGLYTGGHLVPPATQLLGYRGVGHDSSLEVRPVNPLLGGAPSATSEAGAIFVRMRTIKAEDLKAQGDGVDGRAAVRDDEVVMTPSKRPHKPGDGPFSPSSTHKQKRLVRETSDASNHGPPTASDPSQPSRAVATTGDPGIYSAHGLGSTPKTPMEEISEGIEQLMSPKQLRETTPTRAKLARPLWPDDPLEDPPASSPTAPASTTQVEPSPKATWADVAKRASEGKEQGGPWKRRPRSATSQLPTGPSSSKKKMRPDSSSHSRSANTHREDVSDALEVPKLQGNRPLSDDEEWSGLQGMEVLTGVPAIGLPNLGNTCFLSAVVQIVLRIPRVAEFLGYVAVRATKIDCHPVVAQLALLMRSMQSGERAPIKVAAVEFVESVYKALPKFKKGVQQDAEEFFTELWHLLRHEMVASKASAHYADRILDATRRHTIKCKSCDTEPRELDDAYTGCTQLWLKGPRNEAGELLLEDALVSVPETVEVNCDICGENKRASKITAIQQASDIVFIHLDRFLSNNVKDQTPVSIPLRGLRIDDGDTFELRAIVDHHGETLGFGHYTADFRELPHWFRLDDKSVSEVRHPAQRIVSSKAYMLLFARSPSSLVEAGGGKCNNNVGSGGGAGRFQAGSADAASEADTEQQNTAGDMTTTSEEVLAVCRQTRRRRVVISSTSDSSPEEPEKAPRERAALPLPSKIGDSLPSPSRGLQGLPVFSKGMREKAAVGQGAREKAAVGRGAREKAANGRGAREKAVDALQPKISNFFQPLAEIGDREVENSLSTRTTTRQAPSKSRQSPPKGSRKRSRHSVASARKSEVRKSKSHGTKSSWSSAAGAAETAATQQKAAQGAMTALVRPPTAHPGERPSAGYAGPTCGVCNYDHLRDQLVLCHGTCGTHFHFWCVGFDALPPDDAIWYCSSCQPQQPLTRIRKKGQAKCGEAIFNAPADLTCTVCDRLSHPTVMLLCDGCERGFHAYCSAAPLSSMPEGDDLWFCDTCHQARTSAKARRGKEASRKPPASAARTDTGEAATESAGAASTRRTAGGALSSTHASGGDASAESAGAGCDSSDDSSDDLYNPAERKGETADARLPNNRQSRRRQALVVKRLASKAAKQITGSVAHQPSSKKETSAATSRLRSRRSDAATSLADVGSPDSGSEYEPSGESASSGTNCVDGADTYVEEREKPAPKVRGGGRKVTKKQVPVRKEKDLKKKGHNKKADQDGSKHKVGKPRKGRSKKAGEKLGQRGEKHEAEALSFEDFFKISTPVLDEDGSCYMYKRLPVLANDGASLIDASLADLPASREYLTEYGAAWEQSTAKGVPLEIKGISVRLPGGKFVLEDFNGGSELKEKRRVLGKNYIVALVVCEASVHGKPYSEEEKRNGSWRPEPVVPNQRAGYCRLSTADALIASPKGVLKGTLDRWKHTVVPTKDGMHIEIINRIIESNPDELADEFLVKTFKPVGPKHLVEYKYQTETEDRLQQKLDRPAGANCRFDSFVKVDPGEKDLVWTEQGKSLALEPSATRTSGRPTFRVQGWSGRDYDGGPLDDFSSDPAKRSFVAVFAHAKTTLEGMECPPDLEDLVEPCLAMTVVAHVHALAAIEAVRYSETAGGAAQNVEEKVNLLCEVDTSGAVPRAWVFSRPVGGGPESEHVECLAVLGEAPDMLPLVNKYLKQYIPYNKAGVLTWQSGVEANIAVFEAVQGLPPRPHPQEEWIQRLLPLIKVFQSVESFSVSYRCLNDVWTEKEDYEVRAADGTLLMAWRDPSYQERRKLAEKRAKDQGLVKKCYTGVSKRSSDKKRSAKANVWVGKVMHQKREFVKDFSDVHRAAKFRDLCVLMVGKDLNGFDLNFPKVDYEDEEFRNEGLSTPLEWSERRGDGYTWWSRLAER